MECREDRVYPGKTVWKEMLGYIVRLHEDSTRPAQTPFLYEWEHIGTGYCYGPAFGHWDITHSIMDTQNLDFTHAKNQMRNLLSLQEASGMFPSMVFMREDTPKDWNRSQTHPPVWVFAMQELYEKTGDRDLLSVAVSSLERQIKWFEYNRKAEDGGYYYIDILSHLWESGVDEGVRFIDARQGRYACVDATSHVYSLYRHLIAWKGCLHMEVSAQVPDLMGGIETFIREKLFDRKSGFFYDSWAVEDETLRHWCFEGMWPVVVGAATDEQANKVIDRLMDPCIFNMKHPIATVSPCDLYYENRMWRGPAWNSMAMWAAIGCMRYQRFQAAEELLEKALDDTWEKFKDTGTIWEFYDCQGGSPMEVLRKPQTEFRMPCRDYLGHNPLIKMAYLWEECRKGTKGHGSVSGRFSV